MRCFLSAFSMQSFLSVDGQSISVACEPQQTVIKTLGHCRVDLTWQLEHPMLPSHWSLATWGKSSTCSIEGLLWLHMSCIGNRAIWWLVIPTLETGHHPECKAFQPNLPVKWLICLNHIGQLAEHLLQKDLRCQADHAALSLFIFQPLLP